ncbi:MAG: ABC transporter permease subunit [Actinobacteria bacterium]|nr:ABC transporter permease subunit [Actinomycetota bacterium]
MADRAKDWSRTGGIVASVAVAVFLLLPVLVIVVTSFSADPSLKFPPSGLSARWYHAVASDERWREAAVTSFVVGGIATAVASVCGTGLALSVWRAPRKLAAPIAALALAPAVMPVIVLAVALFLTLAHMSLVGTRLGLGLSQGLLGIPIVFLVTGAALQYFDASLLDASRSLGASSLYAWRTVLVPFLLPSVLVGAFLAFMTSFDEVVLALFVGQGTAVTLPNLVWQSLVIDLTPVVAAVSSAALLFGLLLQGLAVIWLRARIRRRRNARATAGDPAVGGAVGALAEG